MNIRRILPFHSYPLFQNKSPPIIHFYRLITLLNRVGALISVPVQATGIEVDTLYEFIKIGNREIFSERRYFHKLGY